MADTKDIGSGTVVIAFVAGALIGAAVALLLAPATGEETRAYLGKRTREGRAKAADAARQGREVFARQRDQFAEAFQRARQGTQPDTEPEPQA